MRRTVAVLALWTCVASATAADDARMPDTVYRLVRGDGSTGDAADVKTTVAVLTRRLASLGLKDVVVAPTANPGQIGFSVPSAMNESYMRIYRLVERPGSFELRVKADDGVETMWRRRTKGGGSNPLQPPVPGGSGSADDPPPDLTWLPANHDRADVLVQTPDRAFIAALAALKKRGASETSIAWTSAVAARDKALREDVFTEKDASLFDAELLFKARPVVLVALKDDRKAAFAAFTKKHERARATIVIDGRVEATPIISSKSTDAFVIEAGGERDFTEAEAQELAAVLMAGKLPCRLVDVNTPK